jgi:hypothetical protein
MSRLLRILRWRVGTEASDARLQQWLCFAAAPTVLVLAANKLAELPLSEGEAVIGWLASATVALLLVILGLVAPLAQQRKPA